MLLNERHSGQSLSSTITGCFIAIGGVAGRYPGQGGRTRLKVPEYLLHEGIPGGRIHQRGFDRSWRFVYE